MPDKQNMENQPGRSGQEMDQNRNQQTDRQKTTEEDVNLENPQEGDQWENYRTRELSGRTENKSEETKSGE